MKLSTFKSVPVFLLHEGHALFRVQRTHAIPARTVVIGPLHLPPPGVSAGRFDLIVSKKAVAYFAESPEVAICETLTRRDATSVSLSADIVPRDLLALRTAASLRLADLRPQALSWPVLQSLRYWETQQIAEDASKHHDGVVYRSPQHHAQDCYALFEPVLTSSHLAWQWTRPLGTLSKRLHSAMLRALISSRVPLTP